MQIKRNYYCIVDKYNRPDYRCLFENKQDAQKKMAGFGLSVGSKKDQGMQLMGPFKVKEVHASGDINPISLYKKIKKSSKLKLHFSKAREREDVVLQTGTLIVDPVKSEFQAAQARVKSIRKELVAEWQRKQEEREKMEKEMIPVHPTSFFDIRNFRFQNSFLATRAFAAVTTVACVMTMVGTFFIHSDATSKIAQVMAKANAVSTEKTVAVLGAKDAKLASQFDEKMNDFVLATLKDFENLKEDELEGEIMSLVEGSPMEVMAPMIAKQDRTVAAFLVGIAKKESNFGRRVPVLNGADCFNYWGYRGIRLRMGSGGHTCFDSPQDAIDTVAKRINTLVQADVDTPQEMVLWKCGSSCETHSPESVKKWISDVDMYFSEIKKDGES